MNYIGSKTSLLSHIERVLDENQVPAAGIAVDLFAGTGAVSQFLKRRGHVVYSNDWQYYSYLTCKALVECDRMPRFDTLAHNLCKERILLPGSVPMVVLSYLNQLPSKVGMFYETYCEGGSDGRMYFSKDNGLRIQAIRDQIEDWSMNGLISPEEKAWLVASLIEAADCVANTASVYGAFLKHIKRSAQKPINLNPLLPAFSEQTQGMHRAFCQDGPELLTGLNGTRQGLIYIDPPYNARQYSSNYHVLETIARWDLGRFSPRGVTGLRDSGENKSVYCRKETAGEGFRKLLDLANTEYILFSYNNEGLVSRADLEAMFGDRCSSVTFEEIPYRRFRADRDGSNRAYNGDSTVEYLILGKLR